MKLKRQTDQEIEKNLDLSDESDMRTACWNQIKEQKATLKDLQIGFAEMQQKSPTSKKIATNFMLELKEQTDCSFWL